MVIPYYVTLEFYKGYYYEHTFMILAFIGVASSKNGVGVGGFMHCAICIKSAFYLFCEP